MYFVQVICASMLLLLPLCCLKLRSVLLSRQKRTLVTKYQWPYIRTVNLSSVCYFEECYIQECSINTLCGSHILIKEQNIFLVSIVGVSHNHNIMQIEFKSLPVIFVTFKYNAKEHFKIFRLILYVLSTPIFGNASAYKWRDNVIMPMLYICYLSTYTVQENSSSFAYICFNY